MKEGVITTSQVEILKIFLPLFLFAGSVQRQFCGQTSFTRNLLFALTGPALQRAHQVLGLCIDSVDLPL